MKSALRKRLKAARNKLNQPQLSRMATSRLSKWLRARGIRRIMLYLAFNSELDPIGIKAYYPEAEYYLPRTAADGLTIHSWATPREQHPYGFEQPSDLSPVEASVLQAIVVPGLAFSRAGDRLGYGVGYYDRFLSRLTPKIPTIGLVPTALLLETLPRDPWDIRMQFLATESAVFATDHNNRESSS